MGLLDKLWDDTVAGPAPEAGLGRLRRHPTFSSSVRSALQQEQAAGQHKALDDVDAMAVTRSITIVRTTSSPFPSCGADSGSPTSLGSSLASAPDSGSPTSLPSSPASAPDSPFTPRRPRGGEWRKLSRRTSAPASGAFEPRSPTVYDWVVISSLDR